MTVPCSNCGSWMWSSHVVIQCWTMLQKSRIGRAVPPRMRISLSRCWQSCGDQGNPSPWHKSGEKVIKQRRCGSAEHRMEPHFCWREEESTEVTAGSPRERTNGQTAKYLAGLDKECGFSVKRPGRPWPSGYEKELWLQRLRFYPDYNVVPVPGPSPKIQPGRRRPTSYSHDPRVNGFISGRRIEKSHCLLEAYLTQHGI